MRREPDSIMTLIPTLLDFKLANIKVDEGNLRVFTIQDFLAQYNINTRTVGIHAILVPNNFTSTTDYNLNNYRTLIGNFTVKYYHFVGGFNNINFIELNFGINQDIINSIVNTALEQAIQYIEDNILNEDFIQNITQIVQTNVLSNLNFNDTDDIDFSKENNNISAITIGWTGRFKDLDGRIINVSHGLIKNVWLKEEAPYTLTVINGNIEKSISNVKYGLLYNWFVVNDNRNIMKPGYRILTRNDKQTILSHISTPNLDNYPNVVNLLKEVGFEYWINGGGLNTFGYNAIGTGIRYNTGEFAAYKHRTDIWLKEDAPEYNIAAYIMNIDENKDFISIDELHEKQFGCCIRGVKESTNLSEGESGIYIGNNGKIYRTVCIAGLEILADNLAETLYSDNSIIPEVTDNSTWTALTTGALCAFNNDWSNVYK